MRLVDAAYNAAVKAARDARDAVHGGEQITGRKAEKEGKMNARLCAGLRKMSACSEAVDFCAQHKSLAAAWAACERGDWLLWYCAKRSGKQGSKTHRKVVLAACACARTALKHVPKGEKRPLCAIETAESWARGAGTTLEEVRSAASAAASAAVSAYSAAYSAVSADSAAYSAVSADSAVSAYSADSAASAAYSADSAVSAALQQCAEIVREFYPTAPALAKAGG